MTGQFQTSLFGYSKRSVHAYIAELNENFSKKLLEKDKESRDSVEALRKELESLRQENNRLRVERQKVGDALIDAQSFATGLKAQAQEEMRIQRSKNEELHQVERQRLQTLADQIDHLRTEFHSTMNRMDDDLERYTLLCKAIHEKDLEDFPPQGEGDVPEPVNK